MKDILLYGDSNVWGDNFISGKRIPRERQWVNVLKKMESDEYNFYQEGLPGRLAGADEKEKKYKNGKETFISTFRTCAPVDILIIALGTNDLQIKYNKSSKKIIEDLLWYENILKEQFEDIENRKKFFKNKKLPEIIYVLPPNFDYHKRAKFIFDERCEIKRLQIIEYFKTQKFKTVLLNDAKLFEDGIHFNYEDHKKMATLVRSILKDVK